MKEKLNQKNSSLLRGEDAGGGGGKHCVTLPSILYPRGRGVCAVIFFCFLIIGNSAHAVGVGVRPQEVELRGQVGRISESVLWVTNTSNEPALFTVTPDSLASWFRVRPSFFNLPGGAAEQVTVSILPETDGAFASYLSLVASPISRDDVKAATGLKIPITLSIRPGVPWFGRTWFMVLVLALMAMFTALAFWLGWQYHRERSGWRGLVRREVDFLGRLRK